MFRKFATAFAAIAIAAGIAVVQASPVEAAARSCIDVPRDTGLGNPGMVCWQPTGEHALIWDYLGCCYQWPNAYGKDEGYVWFVWYLADSSGRMIAQPGLRSAKNDDRATDHNLNLPEGRKVKFRGCAGGPAAKTVDWSTCSDWAVSKS
ncbi:hypothetical protein AB0I28_32685 [Phytomonospora sp. NPDC050363]|uniref:hypothetical protein n=1 Tax=Phytomonospora sp. NPDC050363 TaxID=3155642 RepID=UPI0033DDAE4D